MEPQVKVLPGAEQIPYTYVTPQSGLLSLVMPLGLIILGERERESKQ